MIYGSVYVTCTSSGVACNDNMYIYFGDSLTTHTISVDYSSTWSSDLSTITTVGKAAMFTLPGSFKIT